jgi:hypothetical protein
MSSTHALRVNSLKNRPMFTASSWLAKAPFTVTAEELQLVRMKGTVIVALTSAAYASVWLAMTEATAAQLGAPDPKPRSGLGSVLNGIIEIVIMTGHGVGGGGAGNGGAGRGGEGEGGGRLGMGGDGDGGAGLLGAEGDGGLGKRGGGWHTGHHTASEASAKE